MYVAFWKFLHYVKVLIYQIDSTDNTMSLNSVPFVKLFGAITFFSFDVYIRRMLQKLDCPFQ